MGLKDKKIDHGAPFRRMALCMTRMRVFNAQMGLRTAEQARDVEYIDYFARGLIRAKAAVAELEAANA